MVCEDQRSAGGFDLSCCVSWRDDAGGGKGDISASGLDAGIYEILPVGVEFIGWCFARSCIKIGGASGNANT